ncbi:DUF4262 domain-containing protein [Lysobacter tyrosinilyticus]
MTFPAAKNSYEESVLRNIGEHGWHFTHVFGDDEGPSFSYSVGLLSSYNHPEIILFGLPQEAAHGLVSLIADRAASGDPIDLSKPSDEIIQGYPCIFVEVSRMNREEYALSDCWLYQDSDFSMYQLVWPSKQGLFPWHPDAPESFRWSQPVLGDTGSGA